MLIGSVQLVDFRNYQALSYRPGPRTNLLTGRNAKGKTNLLEGLAVLLTGRSFRTTKLADLPRWEREVAVVSGEVQRLEGTRTIRRSIQQRDGGAWQSTGEGCPWARVIAFGWQDLATEAYLDYIASLRSVGCPEKQVRNIVVSDVNELFDKRRLEHAIKTDSQWWKADTFMGVIQMQNFGNANANFDEQRGELLTKILGDGWDDTIKHPSRT